MAFAPHGDEDDGATTSAGAVCCMCGDHGLAGELFRCRSCRARLQHSYCSDLYPRAAVYRRCNWCLRPPGDNKKPPEEKRKTTASASDEEERPQRHEAGLCSPRRRSRSPPSELGLGHYPVKKKKHRAAEEDKTTTTQPAAAAAAGKKAEVISSGAGGGKDDEEVMMRAATTTKARANRVRVRRYKLLTEVISC